MLLTFAVAAVPLRCAEWLRLSGSNSLGFAAAQPPENQAASQHIQAAQPRRKQRYCSRLRKLS